VSKIKIVKNIKLPRSKVSYDRSPAGAEAKWPLMDLEVGDGFNAKYSEVNAVRCSVQHFQRWYPGRKFTTRKDGENLIVKRIA